MAVISSCTKQLPTRLTSGALVPTGTTATELVHFVTAGTAMLTRVASTFVGIYNNVMHTKSSIVFRKKERRLFVHRDGRIVYGASWNNSNHS